MRSRFGQLLRLVVVGTMALQWTVPALASSANDTRAATNLYPSWYTRTDPTDARAVPSTGLLPLWYVHTVQGTTSLHITQSVTPDPVNHGELLTYLFTVSNKTANTAQEVMVINAIPAGTVFESAQVLDDGGTNWFYGSLSPGQNGNMGWFTGDRFETGGGLPGKRTAILQLVVRVVGPFSDQGTIRSDNYYVSAANAATAYGPKVTTTVNPSSASFDIPSTSTVTLPPALQTVEIQSAIQATTTLALSKSDSPDPVNQGALLTYHITVTNTTGTEAEQVTITETVPTGTVFHTAQVLDQGGSNWFGGGLTSGDTGDYVWFTGDKVAPGFFNGLPGSGVAVFEFVVRVVGPFVDQSLVHNNNYWVNAANANPVNGGDVTTLVNAPAFAVSKIAASEPITAGEQLEYAITLTNTGHLTTSQPYTITEILPPNTAYASSDPLAQASGSMLSWTLSAPLGIGQATSVTFAVTVTTPYTTGLPLVNGTYSAFSGEVTPMAYGSAITTTVLSWPALSISKADEPDPVQAGELLTYTLIVGNDANALAPAAGVFVTDTLPAYTHSPTCSPACSQSGQAITWTLGMIHPGDSQTLTVTVQTYKPLLSGTLLTNQAAVSAANALTTAHTSSGTTVNSAPVLAIAKSVTPDAVTSGTTVTYTIVITNTGNETAVDAFIVDTLPSPFVYSGMVQGGAPVVNASGDILFWTQTITPSPGLIDPAGWVTPAGPLTLIFTAVAGGANDTYSNTVTVTKGTVGESTGPTAPVIVGTPDLQIKKIAPAIAEPGKSLAYTIVYSNVSPVPATNVVITDTLPNYVTGGSATPVPSSGSFGPGAVITWTLGNLAGNSGLQTIDLTVTLTLPIADGTVLTNTAGITCDEGVTASTGPVTSTIESSPDFVINKSAFPTTASPNDLVTYILVFSNTGSATASPTIIDTLPISLTQIASTTTGNVAFVGSAPPVYTWTVAALAPNQQGAITITGRVMTTTVWGQSTPILNTATITAPGEADDSDNTDTATVTILPGPPAQITLSANPPTLTVDCSTQVTATVQDAWGNAVSNGTVVTFSTSSPASGVSPAAGTTSLGEVVTTLTATLASPIVVTATTPNLVTGSTVVTFAAGAAETFSFGPIPEPVTAGVAFTIVFTAYDQYNNVATGYSGPAALADTTGTLAPTTSNTAIGGVLTQSVTITQAGSNIQITASDAVTPDCGISWTALGSSAPFTVGHNLAVALKLQPHNDSVVAGNLLTYTAIATDTYGNSWDGTQAVTFTTSAANAFLGASPGNEVFSATTVGTNFPITGTIAGSGGPLVATTGVTVTHGLAVSLTIAPRNQTVVAGTLVAHTAVATDAFGNSWTATGDVSWATWGGNVWQGAPNILSATVAGTWSVTGTLDSATDSTPITVTHGPAAKLGIAPVSSPQDAGVGFGLTVTIYDAFNNVVTNFNGGLDLSDRTGTLAPTSWNTWVTGVAQPVVTVTMATSSDVITAQLTVTPSIQAVSNSFVVLAGAAATVVYTTPTTLKLCETAVVTATVTDILGNPVTDGTVVSLTNTAGSTFVESGANTYYPTTVNGVATATLRAGNNAGSPYTSQAEAGSAASGWKSFSITSPGVPYTLAITANPGTVTAFSTTSIIATVYDCAAVPNALSGVSVNFAANVGTVSSPHTTNGSGQATATYTATAAGTALITATTGQASNSVQVTVDAPQNKVYLPIIMNGTQGINLIVENITVSPAAPAVGQAVIVYVTIRNTGPSPATIPFWVDLYLDPSTTPAAGTRWDQIATEGVAWQVPTLGAGDSLTLRSDQGAPAYTYWTGSFKATPDPHKLYAVIDVWPGVTGAVPETNESDNLFGPVDVDMP